MRVLSALLLSLVLFAPVAQATGAATPQTGGTFGGFGGGSSGGGGASGGW
ncbi:hypothetical protein [Deinococcus multiflagellatus]|uniref:Uncharacterized protein n=1 Tax=Deinococcus multiflagellatus TaxID=1656887 RepID=A0ABW1ZMU1_9DEIO|nr:hypothetical protein [Deinococcus multiflagellatus]MBZ9715143.1 hypothetical protein [Deinococcus multiflagellatus]